MPAHSTMLHMASTIWLRQCQLMSMHFQTLERVAPYMRLDSGSAALGSASSISCLVNTWLVFSWHAIHSKCVISSPRSCATLFRSTSFAQEPAPNRLFHYHHHYRHPRKCPHLHCKNPPSHKTFHLRGTSMHCWWKKVYSPLYVIPPLLWKMGYCLMAINTQTSGRFSK